jgi:exodeoxyribonuclease VII small subunit
MMGAFHQQFKRKAMNKKKTEFDLEESMFRLQSIVELLESDDTKVQDAIKLYEESIELVGRCLSELSTVRSQIKELKEKADNTFNAINYDD